MSVREDLILDITSAQRSVDALEAQVSSAFAGIAVTVDTAGIAAEITRATDAADTNVAVTANTTGLAAEITRATDVDPASVRVTADTTQARAQVQALDGDLTKAAGTANTLKAALTGAALLAGIRGLFSLAEASSAVNEQVTGSEVVFGNLATSVQQFADQADRIGLAESQALQLSNTFGQLALSAGLSDSAVSEFATTIVQRGADIASLRDIDLTQTLDALRSGLVGETEPLRNIGIFMNEALVQAKAYELGLAAVGTELNDQQKIQARYAIILDQSTIAAGNFALTQDGLANTQRQVRAELTDLAADAGSVLEPTFLRLAQLGRDDLIPTLAELAEGALPAVGSILEDLAPVLGITLDLLVAATPLLQIFADVIGVIPAPLIALVGGYIALNRVQRLVNWTRETDTVKAATEAFSGMRVVLTRLNATQLGRGAGIYAATAALGAAVALAPEAGNVLSSLAEGVIKFGDSFTGFASGRQERVSKEIEEIIGALDTSSTSGAIIALQRLQAEFQELDDVRRVTFGGTHITTLDTSAEESERFDQIAENIHRLQDEARAEIEAGKATGRFTEAQVDATASAVARFDPTEQVIRQLGLLESGEKSAAAEAQLTITKYDSVAKSYVGVADALDRLRLTAPDVESAVTRIRTSGDLSEGSFLDLAIAIDGAKLSGDQLADVAAGLGISTDALSGFVDTLAGSLQEFIDTAVDGLPTASDAFEAARTAAEDQAAASGEGITESANKQADAIVEAGDARAQAVIDGAAKGGDAARAAAETRADAIRESSQDQADAIRDAGQEQADAVAEAAEVTVAGLTASLSDTADRLADYNADLKAITEGGFADLAGLIAGQGLEAGDALADELAAALESGNTEILDGLRGANEAFEAESQNTIDFITNELAPQYLSAAGLLSTAITEGFGSDLDFQEKVRIAAELAKTELDPQGEAIAAIAATEGEAAARAYGEALKLDEQTINAGIRAGNAIAGIDTATFASSGRRIGTEIGDSIVDGFTAALKQRETEVQDKAAQLVLAAEQAARRAGQIESPSKVWAALGGYLAEGLVIGLNAGAAGVAAAGARTVASAVPAIGVRDLSASRAASRMHPEDIAALAEAIGAQRPNNVLHVQGVHPTVAGAVRREFAGIELRSET